MKTKQYKKIKKDLKSIKLSLHQMFLERDLKRQLEQQQKEEPFRNFCQQITTISIPTNDWIRLDTFCAKFKNISTIKLKEHLERWANDFDLKIEFQKRRVYNEKNQPISLLHFMVTTNF